MSWTYAPTFDAGHRAALAGGKNLIYVCPPTGWAVVPLLQRLAETPEPGLGTLLLASEPSDAVELAALAATIETLRPVHAVSGLARAGRLLKSGAVRTLVTTPADALQLVSRALLKLEGLPRVGVLWPETHFALGAASTIDTVLAECGGAQRLVVTADEAPLADFLERHARRAPVVGAGRLPAEPGGRVRYAVVDPQRLAWAVRAALDVLNPASALLWDPTPAAGHRWAEYDADPSVRVDAHPGNEPVEWAIATELPSADALTALHEAARNVLVLARPAQLAYLERLTRSCDVLRLPSEADRARDRASSVRAELRDRIEGGELLGGLATLAPLFDEYDPALVAAAALRVGEPATPVRQATEEIPTWAHVHVNAGRRDRIRPGDVVGALLNAVGIPKDAVGRVDVRDSFSLVEVRSEVAAQVLRELSGLTLRGRSVTARIDKR
ncbi:MAG: DbpA RNA binding domain-containing protein [Gemmatimonadota bacterium]|nr:MAG: DbpA RNA binding domain-containing protein [Gemmatimonadota bacterium]